MDCEYTDPDDILIDSIIDGVHAKKLQERLLDLGEELTLAKAIIIGQQYDMSQKQVRIVRDEEPPILALDPKKRRIRRIRRNLTLGKESTARGVATTLSMTGIKENVLPWDQHAPTVRSLTIG